MIIQTLRDEMINDLNERGVFVEYERYTRNLKRYKVPIYNEAEFLKALGKDVPDDASYIEVASAYPIWLRWKYPDKAEAILKAEFDESYRAFSQTLDAVLSDARINDDN